MLDHKELYPHLKQMSVEHLLGGVWNRPHLSLRERQVITLAANIVMCRPRGNHSHYQSAKHIGISHEEIMEVIIRVSAYTEWPTMAHATKQCSEMLEEAYPTG